MLREVIVAAFKEALLGTLRQAAYTAADSYSGSQRIAAIREVFFDFFHLA